MNEGLEGRVALVTGGSRGIGRAIAERLGRSGARLAIVSRVPAASVGEMDAQGLEAIALPLDLATADPGSAVDATVDRFGRLDILVYSAGVNIRKPAVELSLDEWRLIQRVNVEAAFLTAVACYPHMRAGGWGRMLFLASIQSFIGGANLPVTAYCVSKAGLVGLVRGLGKEWAPDGIRVNAIAPGFIRTDLTVPLQENEAIRERIDPRIPVGRWGDPEEIAEAAIFFCSPGAEYVTGQALVLDGGFLVA